jgi:adenosylhomocysteine nucleosidase
MGIKHRAVAVDMETAEIARVCQERQVPFGCLRAISDDLMTPLSPRLLGLLRGGRVAPLRLLAGVVWRPGLLPELLRLAEQTRVAARQLAAGLNELLPSTLAWAEE